MLTAADRRALVEIGIASDLRVRCFFLIGTTTKKGQWEEGVVTRVDNAGEPAFFVTYADGDEWPVGVQFSCAPTGQTWRPGWGQSQTAKKQKKQQPEAPPATPKKKQPPAKSKAKAKRKAKAKTKSKFRTTAANLEQSSRPRRAAAAQARALTEQQLDAFEESLDDAEPKHDDFQMRRRAKAPPQPQPPEDEPTQHERDQQAEDQQAEDEQWLDTGSEWIGERVLRSFGASRPVVGRVIQWLKAGSGADEPALYKLEHTDGDLEDLEEHELRAGRDAFRRDQQQQRRRTALTPAVTATPAAAAVASTLSSSMRARLQWFDTCQERAAVNIAKGDPNRGFLPYLKPGNALWNEAMRLFYAGGSGGGGSEQSAAAAYVKADGHTFGEIPGVPQGTLVISRARLMALNLHRPIMAGIDYCSRRNHQGKMEPWAVTSIIESGAESTASFSCFTSINLS